MENKSFKVNGIKLLIRKNYGLETDLFDVDSLVDDSLSMSENWFNIFKPKILMLKSF